MSKKYKTLNDYLFPLNYSVESKEDVLDFLININPDKSGFLTKEYGFKNFFNKLYQDFLNFPFTQESNNWTFTHKLYHFIRDDINFKLGICIECGCRCYFVNFKEGYLQFCSTICKNKSKIVKDKISKSNRKKDEHEKCLSKEAKEIEKYGTLGLSRSEKIKISRIKNAGSLEKSYELSVQKNRETCMKRYNCPNGGGTKESIEKGKQTKFMKTGYESNFQNPEWKEQMRLKNIETIGVEYFSQTSEWKEKTIQTNLKNTGKEWFSQTQEYLESSNKTFNEKYNGRGFGSNIIKEQEEHIIEQKYNAKNYMQSNHFLENVDIYVQKGYETRKKNGTERTSSIEQKVKLFLQTNNIKYEYEYKSDLYPFHCDFYLSNYDLYIEILGHWTHGEHPFNEENKDDVKLLEKWKSKIKINDGQINQYGTAVDVWTMRDPLKRKIAKENNINYLEIFSNDINECIKIILDKIKELKGDSI